MKKLISILKIITPEIVYIDLIRGPQGPLLLTFNFNPSLDN